MTGARPERRRWRQKTCTCGWQQQRAQKTPRARKWSTWTASSPSSALPPPRQAPARGAQQPAERLREHQQKGTWDLQRLSNRNDSNLAKSDVLQHLPPVYLLINTKPQLLKKDANGHVWLKARLTLLLPLHMKDPRSVSWPEPRVLLFCGFRHTFSVRKGFESHCTLTEMASYWINQV